MTPEPPSSSDGSSLPPRHRPSLDRLSQDSTEKDLWALEDDMELPGEAAKGGAPEGGRTSGREIPAPRQRQSIKVSETESPLEAAPSEGEEKIQMNVNRPRPKRRPSGPLPGQAKPESDFDDLEHWEDVKQEPEIEELPDEGVPEEPKPVAEEEVEVVPVEETTEVAAEDVLVETETPVPTEDAGEEVPAPAASEDAGPISLRPSMNLSKLERFGLIVLLVLLVGGGATIFLSSLHRLPTETSRAESQDFPIEGDHVTITSATSYWRAPIREGPNADTFRRGTELLPVLEIAVTGGPAAIRVLFRSEDRTVVGDAVTRPIRGTERLTIPATAGFDDPGMHAAYRTGESKPWTIEVFEARTQNALGKDFKKLFEMNISTDRR